MKNIEDRFSHFLEVTGEPGAAAMLVLAEVIQKTPKTITVKEAAERLGVSERTIYRLCEEGQLDHQRVGRSIRIRPDNLHKQNTEGFKHLLGMSGR